MEAGLLLGGLTAANGGFNPGAELMDALIDAVIREQVGLVSNCCLLSAAPDQDRTGRLFLQCSVLNGLQHNGTMHHMVIYSPWLFLRFFDVPDYTTHSLRAQLSADADEPMLRSRRRAAVRALAAASTFHHVPSQLRCVGLCSIVVAATARMRHILVSAALVADGATALWGAPASRPAFLVTLAPNASCPV